MKKNIFEYKIKNRYLIYMIIFSYIFGSFLGIFTHNVSADTITVETWESYNIGDTSGIGSFFTWETQSTNINYLSNIQLYDSYTPGLKTLLSKNVVTGRTAKTWLNFTSDFPYINQINFSLDLNVFGIVSGKYTDIYFYNNSVEVMKIKFYTNGNNEYVYITDLTGTYTLCPSGWHGVNYFRKWWLTITHVSDNIMNYSMISTSERKSFMFNKATLNNADFTTFDQIYIYSFGDSNSNIIFYIDDIFIETSQTLTECGYDVSIYNERGDTNYYRSQTVNSRFIYENFKVPVTTNIKGVSLALDPTQYMDDSNLNNYSLSINNYNMGNPDCFSTTGGDTYILFWEVDLGIENQTISFNFTHTKQSYGNRYWIVCTGDNSAHDLDLDGDVSFGSGEYVGQHCEWVWIGPLPFWICTDIYQTEYNYDLAYKFYYTTIETPNTYNYTDSLGLFGYTYKNTTGYIYDINNPDGIIGSYLIGDRAYDYIIEVYKNGTLFNAIGFPLNCNYPSGSFGLTSDTTGRYDFKLKKVGYVDNITAYVIGTYQNFYISTNPPITNQFDNYDVNYRFYHQQGLNGYVAMFQLLEDINTFSRNDFSSDIITNTTGTLNYASSFTSVEYWRLFVTRNGIYSPVGNLAKHFIRIPSILDNTISFLPINLDITGNNAEGKQIVIQGQHTFPGCDVKVYANNIYVSSVGEKQNFITFFTPSNVGIYTITLRINQDGTEIILATAQDVLTVTSTEDTIPPENILGFIQPPFTYIIGAIIIILLTISPLIFGMLIGGRIDLSSIPQFLYLILAVIGFVIDMLLGFFPSWSIVLLIVIGAFIIIIMWMKNKQG